MKKLCILILSLAMLSACGSNPSSSPAAPPSQSSPFIGTWTGGWIDSLSQQGALTVTIAADGSSTGTIYNYNYNAYGTISGTMSNDGTVNMTYAYPTLGTYTASGTLKYLTGTTCAGSTNVPLGGTVTEYNQGTPFATATVTLCPQ